MSADVPPRRSALTWFVRIASAGLALVYLVPAALYLRGRATKRPDDDYVDLGPLAALLDGKPTRVTVPSRGVDAWSESGGAGGSVFLLRRGEKIVALDTTCPHTGCSVSLDEAGAGFRCPCHQSAFAVDGTRLRGPAPRGLDAQDVRVVNGRIQLRYQRYRPGSAERVPA